METNDEPMGDSKPSAMVRRLFHRHQCTYCLATLNKYNTLYRHMLSKHGIRINENHVCDLCGAVCANASGKQRHVKAAHWKLYALTQKRRKVKEAAGVFPGKRETVEWKLQAEDGEIKREVQVKTEEGLINDREEHLEEMTDIKVKSEYFSAFALFHCPICHKSLSREALCVHILSHSPEIHRAFYFLANIPAKIALIRTLQFLSATEIPAISH